MIEFYAIPDNHPDKMFAGQVGSFTKREEGDLFAKDALDEWAKSEQAKAPMGMPAQCTRAQVFRECARAANGEDFRVWLSQDWYVIARPRKGDKFEIEMNVRGLGRVGLRTGQVTIDKLAEHVKTFHAWWLKNAKEVS